MKKLVQDLKVNPENPRKITPEKLVQLQQSMDEYGDISGIVFNVNTGNVVGGTQRTSRLDADSKVVITKTYAKPTKRGTLRMGYILLDDERFSYREVAWSLTKERGAMVAANASAGEWDVEKLGKVIKDLSSFDADFDLGLTMLDQKELVDFGFLTTTVREHERILNGGDDDVDNGEPEPAEEPEKLLGHIDLYNEDCFEALKRLPDNSVDALITDPPAGISFMSKAWDDDKGGRDQWIAWMTEVMSECLRVMKPGAHGLVWAIPRTSHWTGTALEQAGFEVRDVITHLFGTGFPKSLDISKAIDKAAGAEREIVGTIKKTPSAHSENMHEGYKRPWAENHPKTMNITAPATPEATQWEGWGTALKPASEHWILVRKPCSESTVAKNVLKWGTGGINIDAGRIGYQSESDKSSATPQGKVTVHGAGNTPNIDGVKRFEIDRPELKGRFPANLVLDEEAAAALDAQSMPRMHSAGAPRPGGKANQEGEGGLLGVGNHAGNGVRFGDTGGASRFFYVAKTSASEKNLGLEGEEETTVDDGRNVPIDNPFLRGKTARKNTHPTVKPVSLMRYLCRLVTPIGGVILDPFMGSGTTGVAALRDEFVFIGIEREKEYFAICRKRLNAKVNQVKPPTKPVKTILRKKTSKQV